MYPYGKLGQELTQIFFVRIIVQSNVVLINKFAVVVVMILVVLYLTFVFPWSTMVLVELEVLLQTTQLTFQGMTGIAQKVVLCIVPNNVEPLNKNVWVVWIPMVVPCLIFVLLCILTTKLMVVELMMMEPMVLFTASCIVPSNVTG